MEGALELNSVFKRKQKALAFCMNRVHSRDSVFLIYEERFQTIS